jgi:hypothetical protein
LKISINKQQNHFFEGAAEKSPFLLQKIQNTNFKK